MDEDGIVRLHRRERAVVQRHLDRLAGPVGRLGQVIAQQANLAFPGQAQGARGGDLGHRARRHAEGQEVGLAVVQRPLVHHRPLRKDALQARQAGPIPLGHNDIGGRALDLAWRDKAHTAVVAAQTLAQPGVVADAGVVGQLGRDVDDLLGRQASDILTDGRPTGLKVGEQVGVAAPDQEVVAVGDNARVGERGQAKQSHARRRPPRPAPPLRRCSPVDGLAHAEQAEGDQHGDGGERPNGPLLRWPNPGQHGRHGHHGHPAQQEEVEGPPGAEQAQAETQEEQEREDGVEGRAIGDVAQGAFVAAKVEGQQGLDDLVAQRGGLTARLVRGQDQRLLNALIELAGVLRHVQAQRGEDQQRHANDNGETPPRCPRKLGAVEADHDKGQHNQDGQQPRRLVGVQAQPQADAAAGEVAQAGPA